MPARRSLAVEPAQLSLLRIFICRPKGIKVAADNPMNLHEYAAAI